MQDRPGFELALMRLERIRRGERPVVLDLFAGCGGISLGFKTAGFELAGAIEMNKQAAETYCLNLEGDKKCSRVLVSDIRQIQPSCLTKELGLSEHRVDVIVAGPPCQAYARIGRAKLREIKQHPEAWQLDGRASLYEHFLRLVASLKPLAVLLENVPDILTFKGRDVPGAMSAELDVLGYDVRYTLLNAAHFGVPQTRERFFLMAYRQELGIAPVFPSPLRHHELPSGYREIRAQLRPKTRPESSGYLVVPADPDSELPPAVTSGEAMSDLPLIREHLKGELLPGMKNQSRTLTYRRVLPSEYGRLMRSWPEFESRTVSAHAIRITPRDFETFRRMAPGDQYPDALRIATELFQERLDELVAGSNVPPRPQCWAWKKLKKGTVPPYDAEKFPGKWQKLDRDRPSHTVTAHLGRDCYSHIHPDSSQARTISVREAARLQSFPDGFSFDCALNPALKQIGNAVPPLLAFAVASCMRAALRGHKQPELQVRDLVVETSEAVKQAV